MGYSGYGGGGITTPHLHSAAAGEGGQLSLSLTEINNFSPIALVVALG